MPKKTRYDNGTTHTELANERKQRCHLRPTFNIEIKISKYRDLFQKYKNTNAIWNLSIICSKKKSYNDSKRRVYCR